MRRLRLVLALGLLIAGLVPAGSMAAPTPMHISVSSNAEFLGPTTVLVEVTVTCDPVWNPADVVVTLFENATGGRGVGEAPVPCTGSAETGVIAVDGIAFVPGRAYAQGQACTPPAVFLPTACDSVARQIQIVEP